MSDLTQFDFPYSDGLTLTKFKNLSSYQRQLINWIRQKEECSLLEIALHLCQDEETAFKTLVPLVKQGILIQIMIEEDSYYRVYLAPKRGRKIPAKLKKNDPKKP
ncbi:hypothetical protein [Gloeothece verrucosa]|uniref:MarR family transcriptional regulator n=1 Tax=Gloeothece verrucosa (strain PCC 7822) TaxID=497965 RepID=E0UDT9_GLOV7|nr:hypothetical protein [Gloeothece verrucosa]ADN16524.1 hypothetical protein Cyan7822_4616 [Gloeothece verrucosa PCC 7822]